MAAEAAKPAPIKGECKDIPYRNVIAPGTRFEPAAGRYHLYVALVCPFACRCLAVMYMKGLEHVIGVSVTHPTQQRTRPNNPEDKHCGWKFVSPTDPPLSSPGGKGSFSCDGCIPDTVNGCTYVRDLYDMAKDTTGVYSVPVLWDKKERTIVNNESPEIMHIFNSAFNDFAKNPDLDLYPAALRPAIDSVNAWVGPSINMGVYRTGFATTQAAYEAGFKELFAGLDRVEEVLSRQRYMAGDVLTEADIKLFMTLIRFDLAYFVYFKADKHLIRDYPNLRNYMRELFAVPGIGRTVDVRHIKLSYFTSKDELNPHAIVPIGGEAWWEQPHDRATKFGGGGGCASFKPPRWWPQAAVGAAAAAGGVVVGRLLAPRR